MTIRERVLASFNHQQPDKIPYDIQLTKPAHDRMADYLVDQDFASKLGNCFTWLRPHPENKRYIQIEPNIWEDEFGVLWDKSIDKDIGIPINQLITPERFADFQWPDPHDPARYDDFNMKIRENPDSVALASIGFTLFERGWTLAGMENLLAYMLTHPSFVHDLFDRIVDYNLAIIDNVCSYDIDVVRFGDDWGQQRGVIMGIELWREYIKPRIKLMYERVKSHGKYVMIHCCGKVQELFPELIECGLDIFNPFQPEVMDVFEIKKEFGHRLSFYGGISIQKTLPYGTVDDVKKEVHRLLDEVGADGGYIASPSHDIPADAKPENIEAMMEILQNQ